MATVAMLALCADTSQPSVQECLWSLLHEIRNGCALNETETLAGNMRQQALYDVPELECEERFISSALASAARFAAALGRLLAGELWNLLSAPTAAAMTDAGSLWERSMGLSWVTA